MSNNPNVPQSFTTLLPGDPAPWFHQRSGSNPRYVFSTAAGRYVVLGFYGSAGDSRGRNAIKEVFARRSFFDDERACFFGVSVDPQDEAENRVADSMPGLRFLWDFDGTVSRLYGAIPSDAEPSKAGKQRRFWIVLDPMLRVLKVFPFADNGRDVADLFAYLDTLAPPDRFAGFEIPAPILILPNVFEPDFCRHLIGLYEQHGGQESGFVREVEGKTVLVTDAKHKRRKDYDIRDPELIKAIQARIQRRVAPEIQKVHHFKVTRMERYIVSCYAVEDGGHFAPHRDNTTKGTAHRRFAISINLNADFEGGEISFPEYGPRSYKAPPGCAIVFSAPLLHAVSRVTKGRRYAFLPFVYDEAAAKVRAANNAFLGEGIGSYGEARVPA
jgi:peroxiredoxin/predicted 2-oxoglutarate/Fe(II)-dependent dioxygenase YbiX